MMTMTNLFLCDRHHTKQTPWFDNEDCFWRSQCRRKHPPNYNNWPSIFWRLFFSRHPPQQQPSYRFCRLLLTQFSSAWALYVAFSSLILPLRQPIRPFTTNKTLSGPPLHRDRALFPLVGVVWPSLGVLRFDIFRQHD